MEKIIKPISGFFVLVVTLAGIGHWYLSDGERSWGNRTDLSVLGWNFLDFPLPVPDERTNGYQSQPILCVYFFWKIFGNHQRERVTFCKPFFWKTQDLATGKNNFESTKLKVNDKIGNPVEIAAVIVWQVQDTYKAAFEVSDYDNM